MLSVFSDHLTLDTVHWHYAKPTRARCDAHHQNSHIRRLHRLHSRAEARAVRAVDVHAVLEREGDARCGV